MINLNENKILYLIKKKTKQKNAQALVEFSLCLPLIMLIIGMIISLGQMTYAKQVLQAAAEVGCRVYIDSIFGSDSQAASKAKTQAKAIVDNAGFGIEFVSGQDFAETSLTTNSDFKMVGYRVEGKFATLFPLQWQGATLLDSDGYTHLYGQLFMLLER